MKVATTTFEVVQRLGLEAGLCAIAEAGFDAVDFGMFDARWHEGLWIQPDDVFDAHFEGVRRALDAAGLVACQAHAPFPSAIDDAAEDVHRLGLLKRSVRAAAIVGVPVLVVHPAHAFTFRDEEMLEVNLRMYGALREDLLRYGVRCATENMFKDGPDGGNIHSYPSTVREMNDLIAALGGDPYCACLDIGHAPLVGEDPAAMIRGLGGNLAILHVHDNDGLRDLHTLPYLGRVRWAEVCSALAEIGYGGVLSLEADSFIEVLPKGCEAEALALMAKVARQLAGLAEG